LSSRTRRVSRTSRRDEVALTTTKTTGEKGGKRRAGEREERERTKAPSLDLAFERRRLSLPQLAHREPSRPEPRLEAVPPERRQVLPVVGHDARALVVVLGRLLHLGDVGHLEARAAWLRVELQREAPAVAVHVGESAIGLPAGHDLRAKRRGGEDEEVEVEVEEEERGGRGRRWTGISESASSRGKKGESERARERTHAVGEIHDAAVSRRPLARRALLRARRAPGRQHLCSWRCGTSDE